MMYRYFLVCLCIFSLVTSLVAVAASDDFVIQLGIGTDVNPPTVPTGLTAIPAATSQIDLLWSTSTDDAAVSGYQIYRNNVQVATTSLSSYSDTGLNPGTYYTYYITAFDTSNNVSASSSVVATSTLASPTATTTIPAVSGGERVEMQAPYPMLTRLEIIPATTSVTIYWETSSYVRSVLKWGLTNSYEMGSVSEETFKKVHQTTIIGLNPGTKYQFTLEGENGSGVNAVLTTDSFVTQHGLDASAPSNVRDLHAIVRDIHDIELSWKLPSEPDFKYVRIVRSNLFYPVDAFDGQLLYEGFGKSFVDKGAAVPNTVVYYTVFSYDSYGNISSGAIVALRIGADGSVQVVQPDETPLTPSDARISVSDLIFEQDGIVLDIKGDTVFIDGSKDLLISLPYNAVPEHLKTIFMTVYEGVDHRNKFSFILRVNTQKDAYTAIVAPFGISGLFPFTLSLFDYESKKVATDDGFIRAEITFREQSTFLSVAEIQRFLSAYLPYIIFLLFIIVSFWFILGKRRRRRHEDNKGYMKG